MISFFRLLIGIVHLLLLPFLSALVLCVILYASGLADRLPILVWLAAAPLLYFLWLVIFLTFSAIQTQIVSRLFPKPRRTSITGDRFSFAGLFLIYYYQRAFQVWNLPLTSCLLRVPYMRELLLLSYAPHIHVGRNSLLWGYVYDPDLAEIGDGAVIGGRSAIVAHTLTSKPDGEYVYACAPIKIGPHAVIGGEARIAMGVTIGDDAVVEPCSNVLPFTNIPPGEVWGGNPAAFLRKRMDVILSSSNQQNVYKTDAAVDSANCKIDTDEIIRRLVAEALNLPLDKVHSNLSSNNCADWDSLGQLIISAAIYDRFGIDLTPDQAFQIRSMDAIRQLVRSEITTLSTQQPEALPYELPDNPELLPLLDQGDITRALAERYHGENDADPARSIRIVIASSFTCQPLETSLRLWGRAFGIDVVIEFFGFNQVQQALLLPDSPFRENTRGLNAVLVRLEDMPISSQDKCSDYANQLLEAIKQYLQETNGTLVAGTIPPPVSPFLDIDRTCFDMVRAKWRKGLAAINGLEILDFARIIEQVGLASAGRTDFDVIDRVPYAAKVYQQLGVELARLVRKKCIPPAKVLALDCDGILWGGSVAEDGIDGIELGPDSKGRSFQLFQKYILQLKQRGIILVLASRNHEHDVWEVFDKHPEMVLKREDIAIARINWNAKSQNLCKLAEHLNLSLDTFVFVDDDPVNRLEVETNIPQVTVVPMPKEPSRYCDALSRLWVFDAVLSTPEDQKRTQFIRQEDQRQVCKRTSANLKSYLRDIELEVQLHFAGEYDLPRVAQLTQRTNAFNLSLRRRSLDQIKALGDSYTINVLNAKDRFGDYGLVGVSILRHDKVRNGIFELDTFLLSCRALARGIEEAFLYGIWNAVKSRGGQGLYAQYVVGPRNRPVIQFFLNSGFVEREESILETEIETVFELPDHIKWISL